MMYILPLGGCCQYEACLKGRTIKGDIPKMAKLPELMTAIEISTPGGPEVLIASHRPVPTPRAGEVLLKVAYAGVNRPDVIQRKGLYPAPPGASDLPGLEVSGTVVAVGENVDPTVIGSRQCALVSGGGYAEYCLARIDVCLPVPAGMEMAQAAALPETLFTVWHNVFERGYAAPGETILIHGGTSGIGTMAIKLSKLFGLTVIVTCGSDEKCASALKIGADHAIHYKNSDFVESVKAITKGEGVHLVLDMVAGGYVARNLQCLREDGRHVTIAVQGGMTAEINMAYVMSRRLILTGSTLRPRTTEFKALLAQEISATVWPLVCDGELRPEMDKIFPLTEAAAAHTYMESGAHVGKIMLAV
jgi:putative PIG3 family NAD(P)H quinone oxidoreductase